MMIEYEQRKKLPEFIERRKRFEGFLIDNRTLLNQIVRKFGTKDSGEKHLRDFYHTILIHIGKGQADDEIVKALRADKFSFLQPDERAYSGVVPTRFSQQTKSAAVVQSLIPSENRCTICGGLLPSRALSFDHKKRIADGGGGNIDNTQLTHPYCNTGYKESQAAASRRAS